MSSINIPDILIYLTDGPGLNYYVASPQSDGIYQIDTISTEKPIVTLPIGWDDIEIEYARHPEYLGTFRSQSEQFKFVQDARAILLALFYSSGGGIQAECMMRIDKFVDVNTGYETAYTSEIDFTTAVDEKYQAGYVGTGGNPVKEGEFNVSTLDSKLYTLLQSLGNTVFNLPIWENIGTPTVPVWITDAHFVVHDGIKLLYSSSFIGAAAPAISPSTVGPITYQIFGFRWAAGISPGAGGILSGGLFTAPAMNPYNITQNNGATTYIGNDILQPQIPQNSQSDWLAINGFAGDSSLPYFYSRNNYLIKNALVTGQSFSVNATVSATFQPDILGGKTATISSTVGSTNFFLGFVIMAIGSNDLPNTTAFSGNNCIAINPMGSTPITTAGAGKLIGYIELTGASTTVDINFSSSAEISLDPNYVYVMAMVLDNAATGHLPFEQYSPAGNTDDSYYCGFKLTNLQVTFSSLYNSGAGDPVPAPMLNPSVFPAFKLIQLLQKLIPALNTTQTDAYGFPIPVTDNPYSGSSSFLSTPAPTLPAIGDLVPNQIMVTSQYCIHDLEGQSYISISLNQLFNFCKKQLGCGLAIQNNGTAIEIERLSKYFDADTLILDLGTNVANLSIKPFNDLAGCNLKLGYTQADTNSDFGVDPFITELFFNTPLTKSSQTIDWEVDDMVCEQYAIEKIRAQQVSQPVGAGYNPANPSTDNQTVALYCLPASTVALPSGGYPGLQPYDPSNTPIDVLAYQLTQRNGSHLPVAQSTDPAGASYIYGMYYPDSAINMELSPCRALQRDGGALLHSVLDLMDAESLVFRNTSVMQYNNVAIGLSGIQSNIGASGLITEFADIPIGSLPAKLFRPFILSFDTVSPVNMYKTMNTNPNGYIQLLWKGSTYKGFIWNIKQKLSASQPTKFELILHPETTNSQLING